MEFRCPSNTLLAVPRHMLVRSLESHTVVAHATVLGPPLDVPTTVISVVGARVAPDTHSIKEAAARGLQLLLQDSPRTVSVGERLGVRRGPRTTTHRKHGETEEHDTKELVHDTILGVD